MSSKQASLSSSQTSSSQDPGTLRRVIISCMIGNAIEWYDFALYGYFTTIIAQLFFPSSSTFASLMAAFGVFAAGFIMRPLGALIFGHIGDKQGRKKALLWSIYLMAIPTTCIGLLPTYAQAGILAPIGLTLIRLLQGVSMGGEFTGSMVFIVEHAPRYGRGLAGSWAPFSLLIGVIAGSGLAALLNLTLTSEQLLSWGWRIPFLLSVTGGLLGSYMRRSLSEPEEFEQIKNGSKPQHHQPLVELWRNYRKPILQVLLIDFMVSIGFFTIVTFIVTYISVYAGVPRQTALLYNTLGMISFALVIPVAGWISDVWGRKHIMITAALGFIILAYPLFHGLMLGGIYQVLSYCLLGVLMGLYFAPIPAVLCELFPAHVRYSGLCISHNLSMAILGGTAPMVCTWLIHSTENTLAPSFYVIFAALMGIVGLMTIVDRHKEQGLPNGS